MPIQSEELGIKSTANLADDIKGRAMTEGIPEQGVENIWTKEG
jgi:hypothetical protein